MLNFNDIMETITMIQEENLDIRTITMGISLLDCADSDIDRSCEKIYNKIYSHAKDLVATGELIAKKYGIPIVNKRISVTPIAMLVAVSGGDPVKYAKTLDRAAKAVGVNFIGGYSALVQKGFSAGDRELIESIPRALAETDFVCSSVNIGSTKAGINMDAVRMMGGVIKEAAALTSDRQCIGAAKLVVFCNAPEDNPFMAGANRMLSSTSVFRARALFVRHLQNFLLMRLSMRLPSSSKKPLLKSPVWDSLSEPRHPACSVFLSA